MIADERQYGITRKRAVSLARAIQQFDTNSHERTDVHPRLVRAELEALKSQLANLRAELGAYEELSRRIGRRFGSVVRRTRERPQVVTPSRSTMTGAASVR